MQVGWCRPPPRVVHVVGRRVGRVLCVFALWCTGTGAHWPWPPPSAPSQVVAAEPPADNSSRGCRYDCGCSGGARRRSLVRPARYCAARHGTARAGMPRRTAPHHGMPTLGTLRRHATTGPGSAPAPPTTPAVAAGALPNITPSPALTATALPINTPTTSAVEGGERSRVERQMARWMWKERERLRAQCANKCAVPMVVL